MRPLAAREYAAGRAHVTRRLPGAGSRWLAAKRRRAVHLSRDSRRAKIDGPRSVSCSGGRVRKEGSTGSLGAKYARERGRTGAGQVAREVDRDVAGGRDAEHRRERDVGRRPDRERAGRYSGLRDRPARRAAAPEAAGPEAARESRYAVRRGVPLTGAEVAHGLRLGRGAGGERRGRRPIGPENDVDAAEGVLARGPGRAVTRQAGRVGRDA